MVDLTDRVAVVTGSSRGIGRAIAVKLAGLGAKVVVNYNSSEDAANEVVEQIAAEGGEAVKAVIDRFFKRTMDALDDELANRSGLAPDIYKKIMALAFTYLITPSGNVVAWGLDDLHKKLIEDSAILNDSVKLNVRAYSSSLPSLHQSPSNCVALGPEP